MCVQPVSGCFRSSHTQWPASAVPATAMLRTVGEAVCSVPCASSEGSLSLPSPGRPPPRSSVPPPDLRPPGGPYPLALQAADGGSISVILFLVASLALGLALEFFGHLGTPLGLQGASLCLLGSSLSLLGAPFSLLGSPLGCLGALFGFLDASLGFLGTFLGLRGLSLGFAPAPFGFLSACLGFLNSPLGFLGAPLGSGRAPLIEGKHSIKEIHVVVCRDLREFPRSLSRKLLLSGQLLRYLQSALGLSAKVVHHSIEEVLDLLST